MRIALARLFRREKRKGTRGKWQVDILILNIKKVMVNAYLCYGNGSFFADIEKSVNLVVSDFTHNVE